MTSLGSGVFKHIERKRKINDEVTDVLDKYVDLYNSGNVPSNICDTLASEIDGIYVDYIGEVVREVAINVSSDNRKLRIRVGFTSIDLGDEEYESVNEFKF